MIKRLAPILLAGEMTGSLEPGGISDQGAYMLESLISALRPFQFKGKARLLGPWTPRSGMRVTVINGYRVELDLIDHIQRMMYLGAYERWETGVVRRLLRPGMCFVDVGANLVP